MLNKNIKIILTSQPNYRNYSIEAGRADNIKHFDHHGQFENYSSPCNNNSIEVIKDSSSMIEITHMDADTYVGILRLLGKELPDVDLNLVEKIDNNGTSVCEDKFNRTLLYIVGLGHIVRNVLHFPRVTEERQDVTEAVRKFGEYTVEEVIQEGRKMQERSERDYVKCLVKKEGNKALFAVNIKDALDPSRPYEDGVDIVVVFREHFKTISIYCNPSSKYQFGGKTIAKIPFAGHPKACGSPRGEKMTLEQAKKIFNNIKRRD